MKFREVFRTSGAWLACSFLVCLFIVSHRPGFLVSGMLGIGGALLGIGIDRWRNQRRGNTGGG